MRQFAEFDAYNSAKGVLSPSATHRTSKSASVQREFKAALSGSELTDSLFSLVREEHEHYSAELVRNGRELKAEVCLSFVIQAMCRPLNFRMSQPLSLKQR